MCYEVIISEEHTGDWNIIVLYGSSLMRFDASTRMYSAHESNACAIFLTAVEVSWPKIMSRNYFNSYHTEYITCRGSRTKSFWCNTSYDLVYWNCYEKILSSRKYFSESVHSKDKFIWQKNLFRDPDIVSNKNVWAISRFIEWVAGFSF